MHCLIFSNIRKFISNSNSDEMTNAWGRDKGAHTHSISGVLTQLVRFEMNSYSFCLSFLRMLFFASLKKYAC